MSDDRRLLDSKPGGLAEQLLKAGASERLDPARKDRLWQSIARQLPPPDSSGGGGEDGAPPGAGSSRISGQTGASAASDAAMLGGLKWGAALGLAVAGAWWSWDAATSAPPPSPPVAVERPAPSAAPAAPPASGVNDPEATAPAASGASGASGVSAAGARPAATSRELARPAIEVEATGAPVEAPVAAPAASAVASASASASAAPLSSAEAARQERLNLLRDETERVREARLALRGGDAAGALRKLGEIQARFGGRGMLGQEREALAIEALARTGQGDQARARAQAFLGAHPSSPFAVDVQRFARLARLEQRPRPGQGGGATGGPAGVEKSGQIRSQNGLWLPRIQA